MSLTFIIIAITVGMTLYAWKRPEILNRWMLNPNAITTRNEYFRFLTSGFIHSNWMHLIFNMITFYFFGGKVEMIFQYIFGASGGLIFVAFYIFAIVISDIPTFLKNRQNPYYNSLGASGGVSAVLFCSIIYDPLARIYLYFIPIPGFILGALYLLYSLKAGKSMGDNINHDAHLYGALFGIGFTILVDPGVVPAFFEQMLNFRLF